MKEAFEEMKQQLQPQVKKRYDQINSIIDEYAEKGIERLTGRQIFYQFVARGRIPNTKRGYAIVSQEVRTGRNRGYIDWDAIEDRSRAVLTPNTWSSPSSIVASVARSYREDPWSDQEYRPEVWIEKQALAGIIEDVCDEYAVPLYTPRGFDSSSMIYEAAKRFEQQIGDGDKPIVLYLGDHDPSGTYMGEDLRQRLETYSNGEDIEVRRLGLTLAQVRRFRPPPNPVKEADTRTKWYVQQFHTDKCWELDALDPTFIVPLVRDGIKSLIDEDMWNISLASERINRKKLEKLANSRSLKN